MAMYKLKATTKKDALIEANSLCQCHKMSFDGVSWVEDGVQKELSWAQIEWLLTRDNTE